MNNEPVAWIEPDVISLTHIIKAVVRREQDEQYSIPLYTHPAKALTDEIVALLDGIDKDECEYENGWWETSTGAKFGADILEKIKAILRKTQEK